MSFEQRFASACLVLLSVVMIYAMFTGELDVSLAITTITGLIATLLAGKSALTLLRKDKTDHPDEEKK